MVDNSLYSYMESLLKQTPLKFKRYKYNEIEWEARLTSITGPRGVGKSTTLRQYIIEHRNEDMII